jgi:hypothetical protein
MQYVQLTKLVNGYQPVGISINPAAVVYVEPRFGNAGNERGSVVHFGADFDINVSESVDEVLSKLYDRAGVLRG